jgi:hypothetical protein
MTAKLPVTENILVNINRLIDARIKLNEELTRAPTKYQGQIDTAKDNVKRAEYTLMMALDDLARKDEVVRKYSGVTGPL